MARQTFKPKSFEQYQTESGPTLEEQESRLTPERSEGFEGDYARSPQDVASDYWNDVADSKRDAPPAPQKQVRPLKKPRPMIRQFAKRSTKRIINR